MGNGVLINGYSHTTIGQTQVDFVDFHRWVETNSWILMSHMSFFFKFRPGRKTEQTRMPTLQKPHKAEDPSPTDDPFPPPGIRSSDGDDEKYWPLP